MNLLLRLGKKPVLAINFAGARLNLLLFKQREVLAMDSLLLPRTVLEGGLYRDPERIGLEIALWLQQRRQSPAELWAAVHDAEVIMEAVNISGLLPVELKSAALYDSQSRRFADTKMAAAAVVPAPSTHPHLALVGWLPVQFQGALEKIAQAAGLHLRVLTLEALAWAQLLDDQAPSNIIIAKKTDIHTIMVFRGPELIYFKNYQPDWVTAPEIALGNYLSVMEHAVSGEDRAAGRLTFIGDSTAAEKSKLNVWVERFKYGISYLEAVPAEHWTGWTPDMGVNIPLFSQLSLLWLARGRWS